MGRFESPAARQQAPVQQQINQYQPQQEQVFQQVPSQVPAQQLGVHNFTQMMEYWQGGEATRTENHRCPSCGGTHFFSRSQGAHRGPAPAPMCFDCGYTGLFSQGDAANWSTA